MWGRTDVGQGKYINRTRRMQGRTDKGHKGYRMQILKDTRMHGMKDAEQDGYMYIYDKFDQDRRDAGKDGCGKGGMRDRRDAG